MPTCQILSAQTTLFLKCPNHDHFCPAPGCFLQTHSEGKEDTQKALSVAAVKIHSETPNSIPPSLHCRCSSVVSIPFSLFLSRDNN